MGINLRNIVIFSIVIFICSNLALAGQYSVDANTVMLLHFEDTNWTWAGNTILDETDNHFDASIIRGDFVSNGIFGNAFFFNNPHCFIWEGDRCIDRQNGEEFLQIYLSKTIMDNSMGFERQMIVPKQVLDKDFTIEMYIAPFDMSGEQRLITQSQSEVYAILELTEDNKLRFNSILRNPDVPASDYSLKSETVLRPNKWHHIAVTYRNPTLKIWINGKLDKEESIGKLEPLLNSSSGVIRIGETPRFFGLMDELRISDIARNSFDIPLDIQTREISKDILEPVLKKKEEEAVVSPPLETAKTAPVTSSSTPSDSNRVIVPSSSKQTKESKSSIGWILFLLFCLFIVIMILKPKKEKIQSNLPDYVSEDETEEYEHIATKSREDTTKQAIIKAHKQKDLLNDKSQYGLITSFVNRYYYELRTYIESRTYLENYERIEKLNSLLNSKGFKIDIEELIILIKEEYENLKYEKFKIKFKDVTLKTFESYSNHLLVHFGENFTDFIDLFSRLLREEKISFNESSLEKSLEHLKEETELSHFEKELGSGSASVSIKDVDKMSGYDFEKFLVILFEKMGYKVEHTQLSKDQGADLIVSKFGERMVIQAKRYNQKVSNSAIQEVVASIRHYKADKGMVVTNNEFTNEAIDLAKSNDITLIDRKQLKEWLTKYF